MSKLQVDQLSKTSAGAATFVLPASDGTVGQLMKTDGAGQLGWATDSAGLFSSYAVLEEQTASGVDAGTFTTGAWRTRDLNTTVVDPDSIITSLSSGEFTLVAGNYLIRWYASAFSVNSHKTRLYDVTGTALMGGGSAEWAGSSLVTSSSTGSARVTPSGSNVYRLEHQCTVTHSTQGLGVPAGFSQVEVFARVEILKES